VGEGEGRGGAKIRETRGERRMRINGAPKTPGPAAAR